MSLKNRPKMYALSKSISVHLILSLSLTLFSTNSQANDEQYINQIIKGLIEFLLPMHGEQVERSDYFKSLDASQESIDKSIKYATGKIKRILDQNESLEKKIELFGANRDTRRKFKLLAMRTLGKDLNMRSRSGKIFGVVFQELTRFMADEKNRLSGLSYDQIDIDSFRFYYTYTTAGWKEFSELETRGMRRLTQGEHGTLLKEIFESILKTPRDQKTKGILEFINIGAFAHILDINYYQDLLSEIENLPSEQRFHYICEGIRVYGSRFAAIVPASVLDGLSIQELAAMSFLGQSERIKNVKLKGSNPRITFSTYFLAKRDNVLPGDAKELLSSSLRLGNQYFRDGYANPYFNFNESLFGTHISAWVDSLSNEEAALHVSFIFGADSAEAVESFTQGALKGRLQQITKLTELEDFVDRLERARIIEFKDLENLIVTQLKTMLDQNQSKITQSSAEIMAVDLDDLQLLLRYKDKLIIDENKINQGRLEKLFTQVLSSLLFLSYRADEYDQAVANSFQFMKNFSNQKWAQGLIAQFLDSLSSPRMIDMLINKYDVEKKTKVPYFSSAQLLSFLEKEYDIDRTVCFSEFKKQGCGIYLTIDLKAQNKNNLDRNLLRGVRNLYSNALFGDIDGGKNLEYLHYYAKLFAKNEIVVTRSLEEALSIFEVLINLYTKEASDLNLKMYNSFLKENISVLVIDLMRHLKNGENGQIYVERFKTLKVSVQDLLKSEPIQSLSDQDLLANLEKVQESLLGSKKSDLEVLLNATVGAFIKDDIENYQHTFLGIEESDGPGNTRSGGPVAYLDLFGSADKHPMSPTYKANQAKALEETNNRIETTRTSVISKLKQRLKELAGKIAFKTKWFIRRCLGK